NGCFVVPWKFKMAGSDSEQAFATAELDEPPGRSTSTATSYSLPLISPPLPLDPGVTVMQTRVSLPAKRGKPVNRTKAFRKAFYLDVSDKDWNDWRWQSRHRVRTLDQLDRILVLSADERQALIQAASMLPVGITPYYMSLLDRDDPMQGL